jgi:predicted DCC family thiol-disulfide oxidoreductase YuxK
MVLLYSGGCPVCRWTVRNVIMRLDSHRALDILPFRHPLARVILHAKGLDDIGTIKQHWWFVDANGKLWQANRGGAKQLLLSFRKTRWWARLVPSWVFDRLDDLVNRNRPLIAAYLEDGPALVRVFGRETTWEWWQEEEEEKAA